MVLKHVFDALYSCGFNWPKDVGLFVHLYCINKN